MRIQTVLLGLILILAETYNYAQTGVVVAGGNGAGNAANQLWETNQVFLDTANNMYIADGKNYRIQKWNAGATFGVTVAGGNGMGSAANQLDYPWGVCLDNDNNVYIPDNQNHRVQQWAPGATSGITVANGTGIYYLGGPTAAFVDSSNNLYVSDLFKHQVWKILPGNLTGTVVAGGNGQGAAQNQLNMPDGIFVDKGGNLFIADNQNHRVQKWAPGATSGVTVAGGNGQGNNSNQLNTPVGVWVDIGGNVYVSDFGNARVMKWAPNATFGTVVAGGNGNGTALNQLAGPYKIWVDTGGCVYVPEHGNHRVTKWCERSVMPTCVSNNIDTTICAGDSVKLITNVKLNKAVNLTGTNTFLAVAQPNVPDNSFSYDFWVKPERQVILYTDTGICAQYMPLFGGLQNWALFPDNGGNTFLGCGVSVGTNGVMVAEHRGNIYASRLTYPITLNGWTHIAVVYDNHSVSLFINGYLVKSRPAYCTTYPKRASRLWGGAYQSTPSFAGYIDEIRYWKVPLTLAQVQDLFNKKLTSYNTSELGNYISFDGGNAVDLTGNSSTYFQGINPNIAIGLDTTIPFVNYINGATIQNLNYSPLSFSPTFLWSNGTTNNSISLLPTQTTSYTVSVTSGGIVCVDTFNVNVVNCNPINCGIALSDTTICTGDSVTLIDTVAASNRVLRLTGSPTASLFLDSVNLPVNNFSYDFWVKPERTIQLYADTNICGNYLPIFDTTQNSILQAWNANDTTVYGSGVSVGTNGIIVMEGTGTSIIPRITYPINANGWLHITVVYSNKAPSLFVNGQFVTSRPASCVSFNKKISPYWGTCKASIDELRFWNVSLSQAQIQSLYTKKPYSYNISELQHYISFDNWQANDLTGNTPTTLNGGLTNANAILTDNSIPFTQSFTGTTINNLTFAPLVVYQWSNGQSTNPITVAPTQTTNYTATVTVNGLSCTDIVTVSVNPAVSISNLTFSNDTICSNDSAIITATVTPNSANVSWWNNVTGGNLLATGNSYNTGAITQPTTYYIQVIDTNGCSPLNGREPVTVYVNPTPTIPIVSVQGDTLCQGYTAIVTATGSTGGAVTYNFYDAATGGSLIGTSPLAVTPNATTTYYLEVANQFGCVNAGGRIPVVIVVNAMPTITLTSDKVNNTITPFETITFTAAPSGYSNYEFFVNGVSVQTGANNVYSSNTLTEGDTVAVEATDNGCKNEASAEVIVHLKEFPNAFTPNGDGKNDVFLKGYDLTILNRWGQELYSGTLGWDGYYKGQRVSPGTYFYIVKIPTETIKGTVAVVEQ